MRHGDQPLLSDLTTMRVGGPAEQVLTANTPIELVRHAQQLNARGEDWLLLGSGSNTVVNDDGYPGTVLLVRSSGLDKIEDPTLPEGRVRVRVQAGHDWDALVAETVARGWTGLEALSGIPGRAGAAPVQNIGAYGAELADVLHSIMFLDAALDEVVVLSAAELELGYRSSAIKAGRAGVVVTLDLVLTETFAGAEGLSAPIRYAQLAEALGVPLGERVPAIELRNTVLRLRAAKGMVLSAADHDSWSAGSFFTNPIVSERFAGSLPDNAPKFYVGGHEVSAAVTSLDDLAWGAPMQLPDEPAPPMVKLSAAWLIEHSGIPRGFRLPGSGAAISSKHTLAITNQGAASAADVAQLARFVIQRVQSEFGIILVPEPNLYGLEL